MKKKDFDKIPFLKWGAEPIIFRSLVVIPTKQKHNSGFMCMKYCAVNDEDEPIAMLGGGSDVCHIEGICGLGENFIMEPQEPKGWVFDCIPCGYIRLFCWGRKLKATQGLSDFEDS